MALPFHLLSSSGKSAIYLKVSERGWGYYFVSILLFLAITEVVVYLAHRALHHPTLYRWVHRHHHQFRSPTPWVSMAFHPADSFLQALPHYLCGLFYPSTSASTLASSCSS